MVSDKLEAALPWRRWLPQAMRAMLWQGLSKALAFFAFAYAARTLGPEKLGISGVLLAILVPTSLLLAWSPEMLPGRRWRRLRDPAERVALVRECTVFRLAVGALTGALIAGGIWLATSDPGWRLAAIAFSLYLAAYHAQPHWALAAQENIPAQTRAFAIGSFIQSALLFGFVRPDSAAGTELVGMALAALVSTTLMLGPALGGWKKGLGGLAPGWVRRQLGLIWDSRYLLPSAGLMYFLGSSDMLFLVALRGGGEEAGVYHSALRTLAASQAFLVLIPPLFYAHFVDLADQSHARLWQAQQRLAGLFLGVALGVGPVLGLAAVWAWPRLYGEAFVGAAWPFAILQLAKLLQLVHAVFIWGMAARSDDAGLVREVFTPAAAVALVAYLTLVPPFGMLGAALGCLVAEATVLLLAYRRARWLAHHGPPSAPEAAPGDSSSPATVIRPSSGSAP